MEKGAAASENVIIVGMKSSIKIGKNVETETVKGNFRDDKRVYIQHGLIYKMRKFSVQNDKDGRRLFYPAAPQIWRASCRRGCERERGWGEN